MAVFRAVGASLFSQQGYSFNLMQSIRHVVIILTWFSPYFIFIWLYGSWILAGKNRTGADQENVILLLIGVTLFYFTGYAFIGGTNWGFPRYHDAILPLLCLFSGCLVSRFIGEMDHKTFRVFTISLLFLAMLLVFLTNDPLYFFNLQVKEMLLSNVGLQTITKHILTVFLPLYGLPIVIGTFVSLYSQRTHNRRIFITCVLVGSFATMISLNIQQLHASYRTSTEYGATGKNDMVERVRQQIGVGDYVLATPQFTYELRDQKIHTGGWRVWESRERFYEFVSHQKPSAVIAGLTVNTYEQLKWLLSEDTQNYLDQEYTRERIGTYFLWLKKAAIKQHADVVNNEKN